MAPHRGLPGRGHRSGDRRHAGSHGRRRSAHGVALGVSIRYLQVLFRAEGTSPFRSIQEQRLERAARLLTDPRQAGRTITDIAFGLGFKDASHFIRAFKNHYGTGPRAYRGRHSSVGAV